jgi:hypothetical protein
MHESNRAVLSPWVTRSRHRIVGGIRLATGSCLHSDVAGLLCMTHRRHSQSKLDAFACDLAYHVCFGGIACSWPPGSSRDDKQARGDPRGRRPTARTGWECATRHGEGVSGGDAVRFDGRSRSRPRAPRTIARRRKPVGDRRLGAS